MLEAALASSTPGMFSSVTEATQRASSVQHVTSLRLACSPHMPLMSCPHLVGLHNCLADFMLNIWGFPAMDLGTLLRAISSQQGVHHTFFQQYYHLGI